MKVSNVKEADAASEGNTVNKMMQALEKKFVKNTNQSEVIPESMITKETISLESSQCLKRARKKLLVGEEGSLSASLL